MPARGSDQGSPSFLSGGGELGERIRAFDWASTSLGVPETWPQNLKTVVGIMLRSRQPIWIGLGKELIYLYNDPYKSIIAGKHPWALGKPTKIVWREVWNDIGPMLDTAMTGIEGTYVESQLLIMERSGYPEETYYTFSYSPILNNDARAGKPAVDGIICVNTDDTQRALGERQLALLRELAARTGNAQSVEHVWKVSAQALGTDPRDILFALIYSVERESGQVSLVSCCGIESNHPAATASKWPIADVLSSREPKLISDLNAVAGADLPSGAWSRPPASVMLLPIAGVNRPGVLAVGLNPFRLLDENYKRFLGLVVSQITNALASAEIYEQERERAEALAEIDRAKTVFFSNISHEFRTPLTLMLGPLEEVLQRPDADQADTRVLIDTAHRNGLRLLKLVNSLLDFSRIEAGRMQAMYRATDLANFTAEIASIFRSTIERAGLRLIISCPALGQPAYVDQDMWEKIVLNLVSNAFKFTFEGEIEVSISLASDGSNIELSVRDTGTGIPPAELPRLFERFHRIEGASGRTFEGSGIGLALVQELVKLHGGIINVRSALGAGTKFTVSIPSGSAHLPIERLVEKRQEAAVGGGARAYAEEAARWLGHASNVNGRQETLLLPSYTELTPVTAERPRIDPGHVLLADDNADLRDYVSRLLVQRGYSVAAVADGEAALAAARRETPDIVVSDVMMPKLDGLGLVRQLRVDPALRHLPVILLSARAGEEARDDGLEAGADDYLSKPFTARELLARIRSNLQMARMRRQAADVIRARTAELEAVLATVPAAVWFTHDQNAAHIQSNREAEALLRIPAGSNPSLTAPSDERPQHFRVFQHDREVEPELLPIQRAARGEKVEAEELDVRFDDGMARTILVRASSLRESDGRIAGAVAAAIDITAQKNAEVALRNLNEVLKERVAAEIKSREQAEAAQRQSQKMEALGHLTGGIAHDFNNLLAVIMGNIETLERRLPGNHDLQRLAQAAVRGADRAALLTARLLAFSRRQPLAPTVVSANQLIAGMEDLLRRTLGETIAIETVLAGGLWPTFVDPSQLENAVINLAVNARDAMTEGGKLTIETANSYLDEAYAEINSDVAPGEYVSVFVTDTGTGMSSEIIAHAFEPFYTTKETGQGTGLGLSQVYGFIKQSNGHVKIDSVVGQGSAIKIYLPVYRGATGSDVENASIPQIPRGRGETILVVEDDPDIRSYLIEILDDLGYRVVTAADGLSALRMLGSHPETTLLFTDVVLAGGLNGRQLAETALLRHSHLKILYTTGYARDTIVHQGRLDPGVEVIFKPYKYAEVAAKIRRVLERLPTLDKC